MSYQVIETEEIRGYEVVFSEKGNHVDFDIEEVAADELSEADFDALWEEAKSRAAAIQEQMEAEAQIESMGIVAYRRMMHQISML